jgi:hypothetical protein
VAINIKISSSFGHFKLDALQLLCHSDLAPKSTGFRESKCHVQHIFFFFGRFRKCIENVQGQNQMARRTRTDTFTGPFQINFMSVRHSQNAFSNFRIHNPLASIWLDEGNVNTLCSCGRWQHIVIAIAIAMMMPS